MSPSVPARSPSYTPSRPSRATAIGAGAFLLLALPFLVLGLWLMDGKSRVELRCEPSGGPCVLSRAGWLTREEVGRYPREALQGVKLDRTRSARRARQPIFRPVLETTSGPQPLASQWLEDEAEALRFVDAARAYLASPTPSAEGIVRDDRRPNLRVGGAFTGVGLVLLGVCGWLLARTRAHRRAEARAP
ncbi:hypothetical protein DRW03_17755 [Corallococcus sp. H22C18031201]|uniref:hypothetical protein n=1 Tax=Citreicoccus inhibens TaxID=2849499 RepID=UPI000E7338BD|nr:hypothetical protein [Citreicoccus inhibens]MBU8897176.1 hypothetical protein [Citreicoccus inhibens]RJS21254.1 hypothetical protein DRW03_17755 [Corallococcus sp. H22C18031201]